MEAGTLSVVEAVVKVEESNASYFQVLYHLDSKSNGSASDYVIKSAGFVTAVTEVGGFPAGETSAKGK
jgi:hypothetical protein